jgi:hypothetical protein
MRVRFVATTALLLSVVMFGPHTAFAHQPFFEDADSTPTRPFRINDPAISLALYATLDSGTDVDYFSFNARRNQRIPLSIVIPQIEGQDAFASMMAVVGAGLPTITATLPITMAITAFAKNEKVGALVVAAPAKAGTFYEPFSGDYYWTRQDFMFTPPQDGRYMIVVWDAQGCVGRYTLSVGGKEVRGGDPNYRAKKQAYWTPITNAQAPCQTP